MTKNWKLLAWAMATTLGMTAFPSAHAAVEYTAVAIPFSGTGLNASGQVVGNNSFSGPNGVGVTILKPPGIPGLAFPIAMGINDAGQIVGGGATGLDWGRQATPGAAFITGPNGADMRALDVVAKGNVAAYAINNSGQVIGQAGTGNELEARAFVTGPNGVGVADLGTFGGASSRANGINDAGRVVGWAQTADAKFHAFITVAGGTKLIDLGALPGYDWSWANGINATGQVVGDSHPAQGLPHAFVTGANGEGMKDLGTLAQGSFSTATAINDLGQIVGYGDGFSTVGIVNRAFIGNVAGGPLRDLNDLVSLPGDAYLTAAFAINNAGQILANAGLQSYLLTPVPEAGSGLLMCVGLIGVLGASVRRRGCQS